MSTRRQLLTHCVTLVIDELEKAYERLLVYACVGGMPGYLRRFDRPTAGENGQRYLLDPNLPLRDAATAEPVLHALAGGAGTVEEMIDATVLSLHATEACLRYLDAHSADYRRPIRYAQYHQPSPATLPLPVRGPALLLVTRGEVTRAWYHLQSSLVAYTCTTVNDDLPHAVLYGGRLPDRYWGCEMNEEQICVTARNRSWPTT